MTIHQPLHFRIEILDADRDTCEAEFMKHGELFASRVARMHFDRGFEPIAIDFRLGKNWFEDSFQVFLCEERRRAAAQMNTQQRAFAERRHAFTIKAPFSRQQTDVRIFAAVIARDYCIAGAECAKRFTKWKMKIERPGRR